MITCFQTIATEYKDAGVHAPARLLAKTSGGIGITRSYAYALGQEENHIAVAEELAVILHWTGNFVMGSTPKGYIFVMTQTCGRNAGGFNLDESAA